jgi:hypothetical protein
VFGMPTKTDVFFTHIIVCGHPKQIFGPTYALLILSEL